MEVIIEKGSSDGGVKIGLKGINFINEGKGVPILKDFDRSAKLGETKSVKLKDNCLVADFEITKEMHGLYPVIGVRIIRNSGMVGDHRFTTMVETELLAIGLSESPNEDKSIQPIRYTEH